MKRFSSSLLAALSALVLISGCGLRPMYGPATEGSGAISIGQIDGRIGHRVRQELNRMLSSGLPGLEPGATLEIEIDERLIRLPLKVDAGVTRTTLTATANYVLRDADALVVSQGSVDSQADFDAANSSYGDIALQSDARERAALALARRLRDRLALDLAS